MTAAVAQALLARFEQTWDEQNAPGFQYILTVDVTYAFDGNSRLNGYHDVRDHIEKVFFNTAPPHGISFTAIQVSMDSHGAYATGNYSSPDINGKTGTFRFRLQPPTPSQVRGDPCATNPCIKSITFKPSNPAALH
jgi:hypothetical protein